MLRTIDVRGQVLRDYRSVLPRADFDVDAAVEQVRPIVAAVAERGEAALAEFSERFDKVRPASFRVPAEALASAEAGLAPQVRAAFEEAIRRRRQVAEVE
ncbi:MAG: histidinol dehydrogenase, partial [Propionicimonas sp.]